MLVNARDMLIKARKEGYAVGQFNINNLEWTKAVLLTAQECNSPVILGVSEGAGKYMTGFKTVAAMVKAMVEELNITVPVALHLDHGTYEGAQKCIEAGFTSVMFDGSHYGIEENVAKQYFNKYCENGCKTQSGKLKKIKEKDVIGMNMKLHGRNINKFYCKKCLMTMHDMNNQKWDLEIQRFKDQGCQLF